MARRPVPFQRRVNQRIQSEGRPFYTPPEPPKDDADEKPLDEQGPERVNPGDGTPAPAVAVKLTASQLASLADEFSGEIGYQYDAQGETRRDIQNWLKLYRAKAAFEEKTYPFAKSSNVVVAMAATYSDQVIARILQAIFGTQPHWIVLELSRRFAENAKPYERYLDWARMNLWNQQRAITPFVQDIVKLGTSILYNDFVEETVKRYDDETGKTIDLGTRKGPRPKWIPREDFLCPIGWADPQKSPWCAHRSWYAWDELERLAYDGWIERLDELKGKSDDEDEVRLERRRHQTQMVSESPDDRFGLWAPWLVSFRRDLDKDGFPEGYVGLLHTQTKTWLRLVANRSPSGARPYCVARFIEVEGEFDGVGIPEQVEMLQEEASTIHNQRRDGAHLSMIQMWKSRSASTAIPETLRPEMGKVVKMLDIKDLEPIQMPNQTSVAVFEEDSVIRWAKERVGLSDIDMSRMSSPVGRAAATTVMALMQEGARRFDLNVTQIREALTEQGHQITELWQTYGLPAPDQTGSPEQVLGDEDAMLVRQLIEVKSTLRGLISIQLNASTAAVNREVEKKSNMELYGLLDSYSDKVAGQASVILNPQVPQPMKDLMLAIIKGKDVVLKKVIQSFNAFDLESALLGDILEEMVRSQPPQQMLPPPMEAPPAQGQAGGKQPPQGKPLNPLAAITGGRG